MSVKRVIEQAGSDLFFSAHLGPSVLRIAQLMLRVQQGYLDRILLRSEQRGTPSAPWIGRSPSSTFWPRTAGVPAPRSRGTSGSIDRPRFDSSAPWKGMR